MIIIYGLSSTLCWMIPFSGALTCWIRIWISSWGYSSLVWLHFLQLQVCLSQITPHIYIYISNKQLTRRRIRYPTVGIPLGYLDFNGSLHCPAAIAPAPPRWFPRPTAKCIREDTSKSYLPRSLSVGGYLFDEPSRWIAEDHGWVYTLVADGWF